MIGGEVHTEARTEARTRLTNPPQRNYGEGAEKNLMGADPVCAGSAPWGPIR